MKLYLEDVTEEYADDGILSYIYDIVVPELDRVVGRCEFRFESGQDLEYYGNIGYVIYVPYRGHHFAYHACVKMMTEVKEKHPDLNEVWITCNPDNIASKKTIERLGFEYCYLAQVNPLHELYAQGDTQKEIFKMSI